MENVNVVIVDDNPMILNTLDEVISSEAGLSVIGRADNGKDAIDMIKDTQPDVVLLDLVMPQMDGITVVENIKKKTSMLKNPAFIMTSYMIFTDIRRKCHGRKIILMRHTYR